MLLNLEKQRSTKTNENGFVLGGLKSTASNKSYYFSYGVYITAILFLFIAISVILELGMQKNQTHLIQAHSFIIKTPVFPVKKTQSATAQAVLPIPNTPQKIDAHPTALTQNNGAMALPEQVQNKIMAAPDSFQNQTVQDINTNSSEALLKTPVQESVQDIITQRYQDAINLAAQNQISSAIEKLKSITRIYPNYQDARLALATLYLKNNDRSDAVRLLADGLTLDPDNVPITLLYARALMMGHHNADALSALNTIHDIANNNSTYIDLLASVQQSLGNYSQAISAYQSLLNQNPANPRWLINLGVSLEKNNQKTDALAAYKKADATGELPSDLQSYVRQRIHYLSGE